ncbi:SAM-dependent methyltransferase [Saccharopolyspora hattusasensis]|uniref:SAM-dependent methyltransferase n=1 Tax=Saccharopolyspora hattusasensis TaxID=1128679 RepID=UPI003D97C864
MRGSGSSATTVDHRFFDGLELLEPGVVSVTRWCPDPSGPLRDEVDALCGQARKP